MIENVYCSSLTYPLFLSYLNETSIFFTDFRKILKYNIQWKSVQRDTSCFLGTDERRDGQDKHDEANSGS